jgi:hypothetical protein
MPDAQAGSDQQQSAGTEGAQDAGTTTGAAAGGSQQQQQSTGQQQAKATEPDTDWKAEAEKWKGLARKHEDRAKQNEAAKTAEADRVAAILKAAGIETEESDPVKALETTRTANQTLAEENRSLKLQIAIASAAGKHGADQSLLVPVLTHSGKLSNLDPASDTFAQELDTIVKAEVTANPKLRSAAAFPDLKQGNQGQGAAASNDPNAWLRQMAGRQ